MKLVFRAVWVVVLLVLAACGNSSPTPNPPSELDELIGASGEANAEVQLEVLKSYKPATITTQFNPEVGGQTVYEVAGTTPKGKAFKAVLLGDEGIELAAFRGNMRMQARLRKVQGQTVLAGRMIPTGALAGGNPIAFVAAGQNVRFNGPAAGTVYQLKGMADFKGTCTEDGLAGVYSFKQGTADIEGALTGLRERNKPLGCTLGAVERQIPIALSYTTVQTFMGAVFAMQGSLVADGAAGRAASSSMPSVGLSAANTPPTATTANLASISVKSNVRELGNKSGNALVSFDSTTGTMIFTSLVGNLRSLTEGDILVSTARTQAPDGFMRRVTSIQNTNNGQVEVRTARAELGDMLDEADVSVEQAFSPEDVQRAEALKNGKVIYAASQINRLSPQSINPISRTQTFVLYDQDDDRSTTDDQVTITGTIDITPNIIIKLNCSGVLCTKPNFTAKFVLEETAKITVSAKLKKELRESKQLARIALGAIAIGLVVFVPEFVINIDLEGIIRVEVEFGVTQTLNIEAGVKYDPDTGWTPISKATSSKSFTGPTFSGSLEATATLSASLRLMLWGIAGVSAEAGVYAKLEAQYPGTPAWTITGGIRGDLGVDLDLIVLQKELNVNLFDIEFFKQEAPKTPPEFLDLDSKHLCDDGYSARIGVGINGQLASVSLYALTNDVEDGLGKGKIEWRSNRDGLLGTTRRADKHILNANLSNGTHTITAELTDSDNLSTSKTFTVKLSNNNCQFPSGLPNVNITSDDDPSTLVVMNTSRSLTLKATDSLVGCGEIRWKSNLSRANAGTSTGDLVFQPGGGVRCEHTFTHTYKNLEKQTITAKLTYNGMTVTDSIEVGALIPLNPSVGSIQSTNPSGTRYVYVGDVVAFSTTTGIIPTTPQWSSSVETDNINGRTGSNVNGKFNSIGPRTIVVQVDDGNGGFNSKSLNINVLSALARP
jgi:hypothetical protein